MTNTPRKVIGWQPKKPIAPAPKPKPPETAEERQRKEWRQQVLDAEEPVAPWDNAPTSPGLLDNIGPDPKADPKGYQDVLVERIRRMN